MVTDQHLHFSLSNYHDAAILSQQHFSLPILTTLVKPLSPISDNVKPHYWAHATSAFLRHLLTATRRETQNPQRYIQARRTRLGKSALYVQLLRESLSSPLV